MAIEVNGSGTEAMQKSSSPLPRIDRKEFLESFTVLPQGRFRTTASGLKVAVLNEGQGKPLAQGMRLKVHYTGWLETGTKFDSSMDQGKPFELVLGAGQVIKGWEEGLAGIKPGERRQLIVPANLAYGERQVGKIPPGSTLIFNVEAVAVEEASSNPKGQHSITA